MLEPQFRKWVDSTDTIILVCWDLGHIWNADIYDHIEKVRHGAHLLTGSCQRKCGVVRARYLSSSWSIEGSRNTYKYPRGYSPRDFMEGNPFFMSSEHRAYIRREIARRYRIGQHNAPDAPSTNVVQARFRSPG